MGGRGRRSCRRTSAFLLGAWVAAGSPLLKTECRERCRVHARPNRFQDPRRKARRWLRSVAVQAADPHQACEYIAKSRRCHRHRACRSRRRCPCRGPQPGSWHRGSLRAYGVTVFSVGGGVRPSSAVGRRRRRWDWWCQKHPRLSGVVHSRASRQRRRGYRMSER